VLKSHLRLAFAVLKRRKVFTAISLFGIALTLLVLVVAGALLDNVFGAFPPEVHHGRTLLVFNVRMTGKNAQSTSPAGFGLIDRYARDLPGVERVAITSTMREAFSYQGGRKQRLYLKRTDAEFWRVLQFPFVEGAPFAEAEVDSGARVAVINRTMRRAFFGDGPALGRDVEVDGLTYRVMGVVEDVPMLRAVPFADVWVPHSSGRDQAYRSELQGEFWGVLLARSVDDLPQIQAEFRSRMQRIDLSAYPEFEKLQAMPETLLASTSRMIFATYDDAESRPDRLIGAFGLAALLFLALPTINLVNLSISRILERASEIGVRKAFGAPATSLVAQFVLENVVLTLAGGVLALLLAPLVLAAINQSGVVPYAQLALNLRTFALGFGLAVLFGVLSGAYPAWRLARLHPVVALKGAAR
jgi:putative ABC transport system permease protein